MDRVVSVRIPVDDLEKLRLIAEVVNESVGGLIRVAVQKEIGRQIQTPVFRKKARELLEKNRELFEKLLDK